MYPIVYWHEDEHDDKIKFHLSVHPPELLLDVQDHADHHDHLCEHDHEEDHFVGDRDYTLQSKSFRIQITKEQFFFYKFFGHESQVLKYKPTEIPLKFPGHYIAKNLANRAPPYSC